LNVKKKLRLKSHLNPYHGDITFMKGFAIYGIQSTVGQASRTGGTITSLGGKKWYKGK